MAKHQHMVTCVQCGKRFDANKHGTRYNSSTRRYTCYSCYKKLENQRINRINAAEANGDITDSQATILKHKNSKAKLVWGIICAVIGLVGITSLSQKGAGFIVTTIIFLLGGAALIAWYILGQRKLKNAINQEKERTTANIAKTIEAEEKIAEAAANATKVCPKCGAVTKGEYCEFCGSKL